jgi:hypothetical protein
MKMKSIIIAIAAVFCFSSCIKNELPVWTTAQVEFDAASWNTNASGRTYPIITRIPVYGRAIVGTGSNPDPLLTRTAPGIKKFRVNLIGKQFDQPQTIQYDLFGGNGGSTAVEGRHYKISRQLVIPAKSSFGELEVEILNPGAQAGLTSVVLLLVLNGKEGIDRSVNYSILGLRIAQ